MMRGMRRLVAIALGCWLVGCGGGAPPPAPGRPAPAETFAPTPDADAPSGNAAASASSEEPTAAGTSDGPHISRSVGEKGGVVVFWPRVIPRSDDPTMHKLAASLQTELAGVTREAFSGKAVDVRPEPERVCPRDGCSAMTVGLLLTHVRGGCAVMALVSKPGKASARIVPWAGLVKLKRQEVPFREYPESEVTIVDAAPCGDVLKSLEEKKPDIVAAMKAAMGS
jgi:hypothetical protein